MHHLVHCSAPSSWAKYHRVMILIWIIKAIRFNFKLCRCWLCVLFVIVSCFTATGNPIDLSPYDCYPVTMTSSGKTVIYLQVHSKSPKICTSHSISILDQTFVKSIVDHAKYFSKHTVSLYLTITDAQIQSGAM